MGSRRERTFIKTHKVGSLVKSHFNARWYGKITHIIRRKDANPLCYVETICTEDGRPHMKPYFKILDAGWLKPVDKLPDRFVEKNSD